MSSNKIKRPLSDLVASLKEQHYFLEQSCRLYDEGNLYEAKRIAVATRILLHDTKNSHSIFSQLELKENTKLLDSALPYNSKNLLTSACLVSMQVTNQGNKVISTVVPLLHQFNYKFVDFKIWWEQQIVIDDKVKKFTRKDIILEMANTDGGAHIDPNLNNAYFNLTRNDSMNWQIQANNETSSIRDFCLASTRQIGFEMCKTLERLNVDLWRIIN